MNGGRSSGLRLVIRLPSTTTRSSFHVAAGVADVGLQAGPRGQGPALQHVGLDEGPRRVADRGDRLAGAHEVADERDRLLVHAQGVGVGHATGQHQDVEVVGGDLGDELVDRARLGLVEVVEGLHLALGGAEQHRLVTGVAHGVPRVGELDALDALGSDEEGDALHGLLAGVLGWGL